jgi:3-methyladenine DNA glycosylase AlkD
MLSMKLEEALAQLEALGDEKVRARNKKSGAGDHQFGVQLGDIRKLAKKIKADHELGMALWETENIDARLLAILLISPEKLSSSDVNQMVQSATLPQVADWLNSYVVTQHPQKEAMREKWMKSKDPMAARAGWNLTAQRVAQSPDGLDLQGLLDRIEAEMKKAPPAAQWTMNSCLAQIGIRFPAYRKRAIAIGEKLGLYRDYPASKGCTSPFAPIWINEMVKRQV